MVESIPYFTRASDLDPLNQAYGAGPLFTLLALGRFPEALEQARMIKTRLPADEDGYIATARINAFVAQTLGPLPRCDCTVGVTHRCGSAAAAREHRIPFSRRGRQWRS